MSVVLGLSAKLFMGAKNAIPSHLVKNVKDVTLSLETGDADITTRATEGWKASIATLREASLEFEMVYNTEDTDLGTIQSAYMSNPPTPLAFFVSDGKGTGLVADFSITNFSIEQPLEEAMTVKVTAKPTLDDEDFPPQWVTGSYT